MIRIALQYIFPVLGVVAIIAYLALGVSDEVFPEDFEVRITCGAWHPWDGDYIWQINAEGHGSYNKHYPDPSLIGQEERKDGYVIPLEQREDIWRVLQKEAVFSLPEKYSYKDATPNVNINGGFYLRLYVAGEGKQHNIHSDNIAPPPVERIFRSVLATIPDDVDFYCEIKESDT